MATIRRSGSWRRVYFENSRPHARRRRNSRPDFIQKAAGASFDQCTTCRDDPGGDLDRQHQRCTKRQHQLQRDRGLCLVRIRNRSELDQSFWGRELHGCGKQHDSIIFNDCDPVAQHHLLLCDVVFSLSLLHRFASRQHC